MKCSTKLFVQLRPVVPSQLLLDELQVRGLVLLHPNRVAPVELLPEQEVGLAEGRLVLLLKVALGRQVGLHPFGRILVSNEGAGKRKSRLNGLHVEMQRARLEQVSTRQTHGRIVLK